MGFEPLVSGVWCSLYQLSHNHCPTIVLIIVVMSTSLSWHAPSYSIGDCSDMTRCVGRALLKTLSNLILITFIFKQSRTGQC